MIDETYNANPKATLAAIDQLVDCGGITFMVFGDMLELGDISDQRHGDIGRYADERGIDHFFSFGASARLASDAFNGGQHFDDKRELIEVLEALLQRIAGKYSVTVMVKGSKGMKMLDIIQALVGPADNNKGDD